MKITIKNRAGDRVIVEGDFDSLREAVEQNKANLADTDLEGARLWGANLRGANLWGADLWGADLWGAELSNTKGYSELHDFFAEIIHRQKCDTFTAAEWAIIGKITIHRLCWDAIKSKFGEKAMPIFKKLAEAGFTEWSEKYKRVLEGEK